MARRISSPVLVGREAEMRAFDLALQEARDGRAGLIILGGEAGAGKTRLLAELAARTRAMGGTAVVGSAPPPAGDERAPLAALAQVLRGLVRSLDARLIDRWLGSARIDLAALLPELGAPPPVSEEPHPFSTTRLAEAVLVAIEAVARQRPPVLIALEDLHWADDATRGIVTYVARNLVDAPLVMVVSYRSDALHADEALDSFLAELDRFPGAERLELAPLGAEAVARQASAILGADPEAEVMRALVRRSNGNPFFVEELLAAIIEGGVERPPPSVRTMVEARMARLHPASRRLVETAAVAGADVPVELLAAATAMPPSDFDPALREARDAHLLTATSAVSDIETTIDDQSAERVELRHVLVREVIVESLSAPRRRELHATLAAAIEADPELAGRSELERVSRLAGHLVLAGQPGQAIPALIREAFAAEEARSFDAARHAYRRALALWRPLARDRLESGDPLANGDPALGGLEPGLILERAAQAASLAGSASDAVALALEALAITPSEGRADDPEREVRLRMHLGRFQAEAGDDEAALATLAAALSDAPEGSLLRARCGVALARQLARGRRYEEAAGLAAAAAIQAEGAAGRAEAGQARATQAVALARLGRLPDALAALEAAPRGTVRRRKGVTSPSRPSRFAAAVHGYLDRATALEAAGDPAAAARAALEGRVEAERHGVAGTLVELMSAVAARDLLRTGDWEGADRLVASPPDGGVPLAEVALVRGLLATWRGDWTAAERDLNAARAPGASVSSGWSTFEDLAEAELACWRRRFAEARANVRHGMDVAKGASDDTDLAELALLGIRVEADAFAAATRRSAALAGPTHEAAASHWIRLRALAEQPPGASSQGPRHAALLAAGAAELGRLGGPGGVAAWRRSVDAWDGSGDRFAAAYARWRLAEALLNGGGDRNEAGRWLHDALAAADDLGAEPLAREVARLARRARLRGLGGEQRPVLQSQSEGHAEARRLGLSEREVEVLELLAEGLPDRDIAERLFITTKTTGHHVSHVLTKLGVARRGEAAAVAFRIGIAPPGG
ncbi:hypothetical protein BH23CHL8_BH23CHL8_07540 [soil metagenome]